MAIKISAKHDGLPDGAEIELSQICVVPNGGSVELNSEQEARFHQRFPDGIEDGGLFTTKVLKKKAKSSEPDETDDEYDPTDETEAEVTENEGEGGDDN